MAEKAIEAVKSGELKIIPDQQIKIWYHWMENIRSVLLQIFLVSKICLYSLPDTKLKLFSEIGACQDSSGGDTGSLHIT